MSTSTPTDETARSTRDDRENGLVTDGGRVEPIDAPGGDTLDPETGEKVAELAIDPDALAWEHSYDRTPYANLKALVRELPADTPDTEIVAFSFRHICGLGPTVTPRALERIREERDDDRPAVADGGDGR